MIKDMRAYRTDDMFCDGWSRFRTENCNQTCLWQVRHLPRMIPVSNKAVWQFVTVGCSTLKKVAINLFYHESHPNECLIADAVKRIILIYEHLIPSLIKRRYYISRMIFMETAWLLINILLIYYRVVYELPDIWLQGNGAGSNISKETARMSFFLYDLLGFQLEYPLIKPSLTQSIQPNKLWCVTWIYSV